MIWTIAIVWTGIASLLTTIVTVYMMTMPAGDLAVNVMLLISAMLLGAVCVGLAAERGYTGRPRVLSPLTYQESNEPVRRIRPNVARSSPNANGLPSKIDRKVKAHLTTSPAHHPVSRSI
jgi:hypothetical protein